MQKKGNPGKTTPAAEIRTIAEKDEKMSEIKEDIIEQVNKLKEKGTENPTVDSFSPKHHGRGQNV